MSGRARQAVVVAALCAAIVAVAVALTGSAGAAGTPRCHTSELFLSLKSDGAGLGHQFFRVILRNTSAHSCYVKGYPGVSLLGARKHQIGRSATREKGSSRIRRV